MLIVTFAAMGLGLLGSVLPGLPGVPLIFLSALVYAILTDFASVGWPVILLLGIFAAIAFAADFIATTYGARRFGASNWGTVGGAVGGIVGTLAGALVFGIGALFGLILGTIGGVFLGEYLRRQREPAGEGGEPARWDWQRASRAAGGVLVGYAVSAVTQGILGAVSVIAFVLALV
ncbi:MAG: DUF456 domain-containing protein [Rubrobacteraceae bacterium]